MQINPSDVPGRLYERAGQIVEAAKWLEAHPVPAACVHVQETVTDVLACQFDSVESMNELLRWLTEDGAYIAEVSARFSRHHVTYARRWGDVAITVYGGLAKIGVEL